MNVSCARCQTEYSFERGRVQPSGIGVKCTGCGYLFTVEPNGSTRPGMPEPKGSAAPVGEQRRAWLIRRVDGSTYSCGSLKELQGWILEGRVVPEDQVSRTGDTWRPLSGMQELATFFQVQAPTLAGAPRVFEGSLDAVRSDAGEDAWSGAPSAGSSGEYTLGRSGRQESGAWTADWLESEDEAEGEGQDPAPSGAAANAEATEAGAPPEPTRMPSDAFGAIDDFGEWDDDLSFRRRSVLPLAALLGILTLVAVLALFRPWEGGPAPSAVPMKASQAAVSAPPSVASSKKTPAAAANKEPAVKASEQVKTKSAAEGPGARKGAADPGKVEGEARAAEPSKVEKSAPLKQTGSTASTSKAAAPTEQETVDKGSARAAKRAAPQALEKAPSGPKRAEKPTRSKSSPPKPARRARGYDGLMRSAKRDLMRGRARAALTLYEQAAALKQRSPEPLSGMGWAYINLDQPHIAVIKFRQAMSKSARYGDAYIGMGRACRMMDQKDQAIRYYEKYLELHPRGPSSSIARNALELLRQ